MRSVVIAVLVALIALYLFAQYVRRTSMFVPSRYPEGNWDTRVLPIQPEEITFKADDGVQLHGWLFRSPHVEPSLRRLAPAESPLHVLLVWYHGNAGNITERAPMAAELARRGVSAFVFDWRGYGKSEGRPTEAGLFRDAIAAYELARSRTDGDIVPYGESLGGPYAAYVAAHRKVRCVIIENSTPSLMAIGNVLYKPLPLGWFAPFALNTTRWLNAAGVPVLVMHGKRDQVIPFALGMQLYNGLRVPKEMLVSEASGHSEFATAEAERYYSNVVRFAATGR